MATGLYDKGRNAFAKGEIAWKVGGDTFRCYLVDNDAGTTYTVDFANDDFLSVIPALCLVSFFALDFTIAGDPVAGVCDADDGTFSAVPGGAACDALVICKWTGAAATSQLIAYIDNATGLPVTPNGGDINVVWDNGANKIFKL